MSNPEPVSSERGVSAQARHRGDHPALVFGDDVRSFRDLDERARRLAAVLSDRGAGPGRPVATVLPNGFEPFEVATAAAMLEAPYLPVNWHLKADELAYILEDAGVAVVVGHTQLEDEVSRAAERARVPGGLLVVGSSYEEAIDAAAPLDLDSGPGPELMFYTSGTTSRPKGVVHSALADNAGRRAGMEGQVALWRWTADDV
jgi:long-chain acyl-CoA synthetase